MATRSLAQTGTPSGFLAAARALALPLVKLLVNGLVHNRRLVKVGWRQPDGRIATFLVALPTLKVAQDEELNARDHGLVIEAVFSRDLVQQVFGRAAPAHAQVTVTSTAVSKHAASVHESFSRRAKRWGGV